MKCYEYGHCDFKLFTHVILKVELRASGIAAICYIHPGLIFVKKA